MSHDPTLPKNPHTPASKDRTSALQGTDEKFKEPFSSGYRCVNTQISPQKKPFLIYKDSSGLALEYMDSKALVSSYRITCRR